MSVEAGLATADHLDEGGPLDIAVKVCTIAVLVMDVVILVDMVSHGSLLYKPRWYWQRYQRRQAEERRIRREVGRAIYEAWQIVEGARAA